MQLIEMLDTNEDGEIDSFEWTTMLSQVNARHVATKQAMFTPVMYIESFSYEWQVVTVRAVSKHSDWLSDDFARCDWLNTMSSIPYRDRNSIPA